jgi:hypothetical protein
MKERKKRMREGAQERQQTTQQEWCRPRVLNPSCQQQAHQQLLGGFPDKNGQVKLQQTTNNKK